MVYVMEFRVDGGCRRNGSSDAIGAAACCLMTRGGRSYSYKTQGLPSYDTATNQRAELTAIIMALEWALEKYQQLDSYPRLRVEINSDSRYAVDCMNNWIYTWARNGWVNSRGFEVANRDLIQRASDLDDEVKDLGSVEYVWVPRSDNADADRHCNEKLDEMEQENGDGYSTDSSY